MKKRFFAGMMAAAMAATMMTGCGGGDSKAPETKPAAGSESSADKENSGEKQLFV